MLCALLRSSILVAQDWHSVVCSVRSNGCFCDVAIGVAQGDHRVGVSRLSLSIKSIGLPRQLRCRVWYPRRALCCARLLPNIHARSGDFLRAIASIRLEWCSVEDLQYPSITSLIFLHPATCAFVLSFRPRAYRCNHPMSRRLPLRDDKVHRAQKGCV